MSDGYCQGSTASRSRRTNHWWKCGHSERMVDKPVSLIADDPGPDSLVSFFVQVWSQDLVDDLLLGLPFNLDQQPRGHVQGLPPSSFFSQS